MLFLHKQEVAQVFAICLGRRWPFKLRAVKSLKINFLSSLSDCWKRYWAIAQKVWFLSFLKLTDADLELFHLIPCFFSSSPDYQFLIRMAVNRHKNAFLAHYCAGQWIELKGRWRKKIFTPPPPKKNPIKWNLSQQTNIDFHHCWLSIKKIVVEVRILILKLFFHKYRKHQCYFYFCSL